MRLCKRQSHRDGVTGNWFSNTILDKLRNHAPLGGANPFRLGCEDEQQFVVVVVANHL
ncbi:hypothetical protein FHS27_006146 [Rhodopirellula rubra]|uniref:Uncharacterized protein n=1 Tax=Aporhodopirellula rubra TaxID=980271 RepID=A0A7W5E508_9BACT|nr:hypothetical protein [Aporhodopirellula rubra]